MDEIENPHRQDPPATLPAPATGGAVPQTERIGSIDVLRGVAVLGILVMNIQSFAMIGMAYVIPTSYGDFTGANFWVWKLSHIFADQKFMTIFSMLFGAGIVLMTSRQRAAVGRSAASHYRRMFVLLIFGLIHSYLVWYGDILVAYALCGMIVYPFRRLSPRTLIVVGVLVIAVSSVINLGLYGLLQVLPPETVSEVRQEMDGSAEETAEELRVYRGDWLDQLRLRAITSLVFQTIMFLLFTLWRAGGLMLVGMALFKMGVFSAKCAATTYWILILCGLLVGVPVIWYGDYTIVERGWDAVYVLCAGGQYNYWASILVSLAYVAAVMLVCQQPNLHRFTRPFAAVGQMALTNYLMQSIICTSVFYGHGFGLFGHVERTGQIGIVFAVWVFQLVISPIWLKHFRFGPVEWLWRALTYWNLPPLRWDNRTAH